MLAMSLKARLDGDHRSCPSWRVMALPSVAVINTCIRPAYLWPFDVHCMTAMLFLLDFGSETINNRIQLCCVLMSAMF